VRDVRVMAGLGVTARFRLLSQATAPVAGGPVEEVFVLGVFNPQEDSASVERFATSITNAIDVEQLERFGDADVAAALNRVVGVAVTDSKYATVRGLDGRYISSTLNGLLMPSTDPQRRDVQLDLFPTDILGGIEIQKSYTPDQLATTTGGSIKILTKGLPDEQIRKVSASLGFNTDFTGDDILNYRSSNEDWAGFDSGLRKLPGGVLAATDGGRSLTICDPSVADICTSPIDAARLGVRFQDDYNVGDKTALPDGSASAVLADRLEAGDNEWGYYLAATYDHSTGDRGTAELDNPLETSGSYMRSRETTDLNGYLAVGYEFGIADELYSKTTFLRSSDDTTRVENGVDGAEENQVDSTILEWVERQFISQAFTGHHEREFDEGLHALDWRVAYSRTERDEPDRRQYSYFNGNLSTSAFERRWSDLEEDSFDIAVDYALNWDWGSVSSTEFKTGVLWSDKEREVDQYRFGIRLGERGDDISLGIDQDLEEILSYQNFAADRVRLAANTTDTDSYESQEEIQAVYFSTNTELGEDWALLAGVRYEEFSQNLDYPNDDLATSELEADDWYPALALTWRPTEEWQVRLGFSQTVSYPGLIERSEAQSFDPDTDDQIFGNPDLEVSTIDNYDARIEYYFSDSESLSIALFAKEIENPIERALPDASGSAARGITFRNQDSADLLGIEIDANKILLDEDDYTLFVGGNIAYIDSEVTLSADSIRLEGAGADGRQLQGQSEWLANVQFGFDHYPTEQKLTLLVNYFDDRIFRIARGAATGPEIEDARVVIDLTYEKMFSEALTLKASIKNLLNEDVEYSQNGRTIESYQTGTSIGVGVSYRF
jgi:outer membrane receptor protein involved in Fe transport